MFRTTLLKSRFPLLFLSVGIFIALMAVFPRPTQAFAPDTTTHCGVIASNETWAAGDNVHLLTCDVTVAYGVTLTIEPGAIVKLQTDDSLLVEGKLVANGTIGELIYFTSYRDDSVGGDTNGDGGSVGLVQDWGRIKFTEGSDDTSSIQNAEIRFSGNDGPYSSNVFGAVELDNASPVLQGINFYSNYINGIELGDSLWATDTWDNDEIVYYIRQDVTIPTGNVLSVTPGVIIKLTTDVSLVIQGELQVHGTDTNHVIFTSYRDDASGGDTNNNGTSAGAVQDWGRIAFSPESQDSSVIEYASIKFSGNDGPYSSNVFGAITLNNASPVLRDITFIENYYDGAELVAGGWTSDAWDNPDVIYYSTGNITILDLHTITITATQQIAFRGDLTVEGLASLVVQPGSVLKFDTDDSLLVYGKLETNGTVNEPVYFTSYKDDSIGGDTNGNGGSVGAVQDWGRISFAEDSDDTSRIQNAEVRFSGNDGPYSSNVFGAIELNNASPTLNNITFISNYVNGVVIANGLWNSDTWDNTEIVYYVNRDVTIPTESVLTIEPGVKVKFTPDSSLIIQGEIQVNGTGTDHVIFTSYRDDTIGGDTNNNGASTGTVQDWGRILFGEGSQDTSTLDYLDIRYSGNDGPYSSSVFGAIELDNASPILQNITFFANYINGVVIADTIWETDTWDNTDIVYYINRDVTIPIGSTLTIAPGVMLKFTLDSSLFIMGELQAHGTLSALIQFTSYRDDTIGGDTNNNGATSGAVQDWGRIEFTDDSLDSSVIEYAVIQYSGNDGPYSSSVYAAIRIVNASPTINCVVLTKNYQGIGIVGDSNPTITCMDIFENTSFGIVTDNPDNPIDAQNLWWGHASGPTHAGNPGGQGQSVSDGVNYSPWIGQPFIVEPPPAEDTLQIYLPAIVR